MSSTKVYISRKELDLSFIQVDPDDWVVLKPNQIKESLPSNKSEWRSVITSPEVIARVCEHVCQQLSRHGRVTICDGPQHDSSFEEIAEKTELYPLAKKCRERYGVEVEVLDLRNEQWIFEQGIVVSRHALPGDPRGALAFNLGRESMLFNHPGEGRFYGADYDTEVVNRHHHGDTHEYLISATPILADVFINLPKMKTHRKVGVTLNLKNLVGINASKNWLPHYAKGTPGRGGDQFPEMTLKRRIEHASQRVARWLALRVPNLGPRVAQLLKKPGVAVFGKSRRVIRDGNWHGNNTTWPMVLDLNRCLLFGNSDGTLRRDSPKRFYSVVDGMIGMEGFGPLEGDPVASNVMIGGTDPVAVDAVAARVMGYDWRKIPMIKHAFDPHHLPITSVTPEEIEVESDVSQWTGKFVELEPREFLQFEPALGWQGCIEYRR